MTFHCLTFLRTSIFINFITNLHEFYFFFLYLLVCYWYHVFFSFITLVWGKYKQLNSVKHRMPYVLIESACCRIRSKKNCKFYIKTEKNHNLQGWKIKCSCIMVVVLHWFCKHEFIGEAGFASTTKLNTQVFVFIWLTQGIT